MLTLVLLPGMDGTGTLFEPFVVALGGQVAVCVVRYPGDVPQGYDELARLAQAALPPHGDVMILGESISGPVAITLASRVGARVKGLILCCSFDRNPRPGLSWLRACLRLMPTRWVPRPMSLLAWLLMGRFGTTPLRAALRAAMSRVSGQAMQTRLLAVLAADARPALARLRLPLLYLQASEDRLVPERCARWIQQACPQTVLVRLSAPHFLLQTRPGPAADAVRSFVLDALG